MQTPAASGRTGLEPTSISVGGRSSPTKNSPDRRSILEQTSNHSSRGFQRQTSRYQVQEEKVGMEPLLEQNLFDDERTASEYFKGLISSAGLRVAWSSMLKRLRDVEEKCNTDGQEQSGDKFERSFVTRKECRKLAKDAYAQVLEEQSLRLDKLEAEAEAATSRSDMQANSLDDIKAQLSLQEQALANANADIAAANEQDEDHHGIVMALHREHEESVKREHAFFDARCDDLWRRAEDEEKARLDLEEEHKRLHAMIYDKGLHETFRQICREILADYVSWENMQSESDKIHRRAVDDAKGPVMRDLRRVEFTLKEKIEYLDKDQHELKATLHEVNDRVISTDAKFSDKVEDIMESLKECAQYDVVKAMEHQLNERVHHNENDFMDFKVATTSTLDTHMTRLTDIRNMLDDHEHCLRHHAEEILNRSTKYDMVICEQKVDQCALKEKVDSDLEGLQKTVTWQSVRLEEVIFKANFGDSGMAQVGAAGPRDSSQSADTISDEEAQLDRSQTGFSSTNVSGNALANRSDSKVEENGSEPDSPRGTLKFAEGSQGSARARGGPPAPIIVPYQQDSELFAVLQSQVESLAHCVLGLAHQALRAPKTGSSREERLRREQELLFHLQSLVYWVTHRRAPADWDPTRLMSLALQCMRVESVQRRLGQSPQQSVFSAENQGGTQGAGGEPSQEMGRSSVSSSSRSTMEFASTESVGTSKTGRRGFATKSSRKASPAKQLEASALGAAAPNRRRNLSPPANLKAPHRGAAPVKQLTATEAFTESEVAAGDQIGKTGPLQTHGFGGRTRAGNTDQLHDLVRGAFRDEGPPDVKRSSASGRGSSCAPPAASSLLNKRTAAERSPRGAPAPAVGSGGLEADSEADMTMQASSLPPLTIRASSNPSPGADAVKSDGAAL